MRRQRIYNPAQLTPDELKASFVARHETLARMLQLLTEQKPGHPCQHLVLVGPRGMGKTTLGLSFLQAVREQEDLSTKWQPVPFPEESYEIGDWRTSGWLRSGTWPKPRAKTAGGTRPMACKRMNATPSGWLPTL